MNNSEEGVDTALRKENQHVAVLMNTNEESAMHVAYRRKMRPCEEGCHNSHILRWHAQCH